jgi:hypothetical protein
MDEIMVEEEKNNTEDLTEEEAFLKLAQAMKDNAPAQDEKQNVHTFLVSVVQATDIDKTSKLGNLRDDNNYNELGFPVWHVRGSLEMARISDMIMGNNFFSEYFNKAANETLATSLSREGFLIRQSNVQTKQVADVTKRRKVHKGMFGQKKVEESGGDTTGSS